MSSVYVSIDDGLPQCCPKSLACTESLREVKDVESEIRLATDRASGLVRVVYCVSRARTRDSQPCMQLVYTAISWYAMGLPRTGHAGRVSQGRCRYGLLKYILGCTTITSACNSLSSSMMRDHGMSQTHYGNRQMSATVSFNNLRSGDQAWFSASFLRRKQAGQRLGRLASSTISQHRIDRLAFSTTTFIFASGECNPKVHRRQIIIRFIAASQS